MLRYLRYRTVPGIRYTCTVPVPYGTRYIPVPVEVYTSYTYYRYHYIFKTYIRLTLQQNLPCIERPPPSLHACPEPASGIRSMPRERSCTTAADAPGRPAPGRVSFRRVSDGEFSPSQTGTAPEHSRWADLRKMSKIACAPFRTEPSTHPRVPPLPVLICRRPPSRHLHLRVCEQRAATAREQP